MTGIIFGWPGILVFLAITTIAIGRSDYKLLIAALILSLPSCLYLAGANNRFTLAAAYIPISLGISAYLMRKKINNKVNNLVPNLLILPVYLFYAHLGYLVYTQ